MTGRDPLPGRARQGGRAGSLPEQRRRLPARERGTGDQPGSGASVTPSAARHAHARARMFLHSPTLTLSRAWCHTLTFAHIRHTLHSKHTLRRTCVHSTTHLPYTRTLVKNTGSFFSLNTLPTRSPGPPHYPLQQNLCLPITLPHHKFKSPA